MSRRAIPSRRLADGVGVPLIGSLTQKSRNSPLLSLALVLVGGFLLIGYSYSGTSVEKESSSIGEGLSCTAEVQRAIPILKKAYGDIMHKVLHVGPETCTVVTELFKEEDTEAWGVEPYELEDVDGSCKNLVRKGIVRVADIKFSLPYQPKSFTLIIVSDALDYLSPKYLNKTLPDLARVASDGLVSLLVIQVDRGVSSQSYQNLGDRPNCGVLRGGLGISFRTAWKRMKLSQRSLSTLRARGRTNQAVKFSTSPQTIDLNRHHVIIPPVVHLP